MRGLRPDMSARRVAHEHPTTRAVFLRYSEENDRPEFCHLETLGRFAERRGVDLDQLSADRSAAADIKLDLDADELRARTVTLW